MSKKPYEAAEVEIIRFEEKDVITESNLNGAGDNGRGITLPAQ